MSNLEFIDQTVIVEARLLPDGQMIPIAFAWQGRRRAITGIGRQWQEADTGKRYDHFLVQTAGSDVFELQMQPATGEWRLLRAWLQDRSV